MPILLKRIYEKPTKEDGVRVLVERLWPRGLTKKEAKIDLWLKEAAPSSELRRWFSHDSSKWKAFKKRYFTELAQQMEILSPIVERAGNETVTFVFASREERFNNAVALKEFLEQCCRNKLRFVNS
jgi:uncharacterized protein YeaO (DUF488 family)